MSSITMFAPRSIISSTPFVELGRLREISFLMLWS
uniref:Uncharacterized protein n=1 Tax=Anguilla anguilla TaxID=7936 RepID=A0A0E9SJD7_ANGAN